MLGHHREERVREGIVSALICVSLSVFLIGMLTWVGRYLLVGVMRQDEVTWWVALILACLVWLLEELLQVTFPCRRALRRFAWWLAQEYLKRRPTGTESAGRPCSESSRAETDEGDRRAT